MPFFPIKGRIVRLEEDEIAIELDRCAIKLKELLYSIRKSLDRSGGELVDEFFSTGSRWHLNSWLRC